jgi:hypothetical protein
MLIGGGVARRQSSTTGHELIQVYCNDPGVCVGGQGAVDEGDVIRARVRALNREREGDA